MLPLVTLNTDQLTLTPLTIGDAEGMLAVYVDERMYTYTGGTAPTATELRQRYERLAGGWNHDRSEQWCNWIVRLHGAPQPVGAMQATIAAVGSWAAVAWEIAVDQQGKGYATEAARAIVEWLATSGVARITAAVNPQHQASAHVARRAGLVSTNELTDGEVVWELLVSSS